LRSGRRRRRRKTRKRRRRKEDEEEFLIQTHGAILGERQCCNIRKFHMRLQA
jgi:hypothetical protein